MKILLISHIADPDGITPIILSKLIYDNVEPLLFQASEASSEILKLINNHAFDNYDIVYITDLGINEEVSKMIDNDDNLKSKVKLFDHHIGNISKNNYSFATIIDSDEDGNKQSGTSLYYQYLLKTYDNQYLKQESVHYFVNLVREYDTWEWTKTNNIDAKKLAHLFELYGRDDFVEHFLSFFKTNDTFFFDEKESFLLEVEERRINTYIDKKKEEVIPVSILGHNVGIVFATSYRSELGNALAKHFDTLYDFIIIINIEHGISYRGIKDINLSDIASNFGGKGHFYSSGSPIPNDLQSKIIKHIFGDKVMINTI